MSGLSAHTFFFSTPLPISVAIFIPFLTIVSPMELVAVSLTLTSWVSFLSKLPIAFLALSFAVLFASGLFSTLSVVLGVVSSLLLPVMLLNALVIVAVPLATASRTYWKKPTVPCSGISVFRLRALAFMLFKLSLESSPEISVPSLRRTLPSSYCRSAKSM